MPLTVEFIACLRFMLGVNLELMLLFVNLVGYVPVWTLDSWSICYGCQVVIYCCCEPSLVIYYLLDLYLLDMLLAGYISHVCRCSLKHVEKEKAIWPINRVSQGHGTRLIGILCHGSCISRVLQVPGTRLIGIFVTAAGL